jgi:hypothetical protein
VIRGKTNRKDEYWQSIHGERQVKGFRKIFSAKRTGELLRLSRNQLRVLMGMLTGFCHLEGQLFKLGLVDCPWYDICQQASEVA